VEFTFGLSFTVIEAPDPLQERSDTYDARRDFYSARRTWLGEMPPGTDWLHDALEREFGEDYVWYDVYSQRNAAHVGASVEVATVVLVLLGAPAIEFARRFAGKIGERAADDLWDWVRGLARERMREDLSPPDLSGRNPKLLAKDMRYQLAEIAGLPPDQIELVSSAQQQDAVLLARYRDRESGTEYAAEVQRSEVVFRRIGAPEPDVPRRDDAEEDRPT
jgi:hypothetical protein